MRQDKIQMDSTRKRLLLERAQGVGVGNNAKVERIGELIDNAGDDGWIDGLNEGVKLCQELQKSTASEKNSAIAMYFEANALNELQRLQGNQQKLREWEQPNYEQRIVLLRQSERLAERASVNKDCRAAIATNLANVLSAAGRIIEAITYWNKAIRLVSSFPMARGNRGIGLYSNGQFTHDPGHRYYLLRLAYEDLTAVANSPIHPEARKCFSDCAKKIEKLYGLKRLTKDFDLNKYSLGKLNGEIQYRRWSLQKGLFLNPLNELGPNTISATDSLMLPVIMSPRDDGLCYLGLFNQLKQEFVSARFFYYSGISGSNSHFSDSDVKLTNTLDYPSYSLAVEQIKVSFRIAYSIFDKVAFFLNHYLALSFRDDDVSFRRIWYDKGDRKKGVHEKLSEYQRNTSLKALFWVSKDLFEQKPGFRDAIEPDAREIVKIRNHIEHKYLKLHDFDRSEKHMGSNSNMFSDTLAYSVGRNEFEKKALRTLSLARATLIYLTQAIYINECRNEKKVKGFVIPMYLDSYKDEWKR